MNDRPDTLPAVGTDYGARYVVVNCTNEVISDVVCIHECAEISWTNKTAAPTLLPGEATPVQILRSRSLRVDTWCAALTRNGSMYVKGAVDCNVTPTDAGGLCVIGLQEETVRIIPPHSDSDSFSFRPIFATTPEQKKYMAADGSVPAEEDPQAGQKKTAGVGVNEDYSGGFVVINATNGPITDVHITHTCNEMVTPFKRFRMENDEVAPLTKITAATLHNDYWTISFRDTAGQIKSRQNKKCNYELGDRLQACLIILYEDSFSVVPPVTSGCYNNHY